MTSHRHSLFGLVLASLTLTTAASHERILEVTADPPHIVLRGSAARHSILVHATEVGGYSRDLTRAARFESAAPEVVQVSETGVVAPMRDGETQVRVHVADRVLSIDVVVECFDEPRQYSFENDIVPILSRFACNSSGCHGKAEGQNGFKLSVFGFDPVADYAALSKESRGRRVFPAAPERSLFLAKASGAVPHGGGVRIARGSAEYQTIQAWIAAGMPFGDDAAPHVVELRIEPPERLMTMHSQQQLRVIATYSDGREVDVTNHARFQSNNDALASVSELGLVTVGDAPGDVAIMANFMNVVDTFRAIVPRSERIENYPELPEANFIDTLVYKKLRKLNILPSGIADDAEFLRRVHLDIIGRLPTAEEAHGFLEDTRANRRDLLVERLLNRPEFADFWALRWSDLLRVDRQVLGHKRAYGFYRWIRESFAANKPLDQFARELVTADGPLEEVGPANFYKVASKPGDAASTASQVFLGVRIACAECHHHPFDRWSQADYLGMQAFFAPVSLVQSPRGEAVMAAGDPPTQHPRTGERIFAYALGTNMPEAMPPGDRRTVLADWLVARDNAWFARNLANRTWAHFFGRGLIEPVDDIRDTNPPSNPELLDALAQHLIENQYDFRQLIRTITASRVYQASSSTNETNVRDELNFSRAMFKRPDAEVLLDMICDSTGIGEKFPGVPAGTRAVQLWDSKVSHYFLQVFGRPMRATACQCERVSEASVSQVLHLLNSPEIQRKLSHEAGTVARLVQQTSNPPDEEQLVEQLYLTFYSRFPTDRERTVAVEYLTARANVRRQAAEDLAWTLMNTLEFVFNH